MSAVPVAAEFAAVVSFEVGDAALSARDSELIQVGPCDRRLCAAAFSPACDTATG